MEAVATAIPCNGAALVPVRSHFPRLPYSRGVEELSNEYINGGWYADDHRYRGLPELFRIGVTSDLSFITPEEIRRSNFYQDFLLPHDCPWFAGIKFAAGDDIRCLTIQRSDAHGPFTSAEVRTLSELARSLETSAQMALALNSAKAEAALASFEASHKALILLNARGEPNRLNRSAERLLGQHIKIVNRRLTSWSRTATMELDTALRQLLLDSEPSGTRPPVILPRMEPSGRPLLAYLLRIPGVTSDVFGAARAAIVLVDLAAEMPAPEDVLRSVFKLTPTEGRLAQSLARGHSLEAASEQLGFSKETARTHLKAVFAKTGTTRQGELVALLGRLKR